MEKYLKIGDYFGGDLSVSSGTRERIVSAKGEVLATTPSPQVAKFAAHAINSHDELVAMNKELLAALESIENDAGQVPDFMWNMIKSAIAKAKAGTA